MIGEILKKTREEAGLDLRGIADELRIQAEFLNALENNALEKLPPEVYSRGYIKEYSKFLKIDPEPLLNEYSEYLKKRDIEVRTEPLPEKKDFKFPRILMAVPVLVAVFLALMIYSPKNSPKTGIPPFQLPPAPETKKEQPHEVSPEDYTLNVTAAETTWISIETGEGKTEEMLMRPGETKKWMSKNGFNLKLGNAGGVKLVFNDKDMGTLGEKGQVLRLRLPEENSSGVN